MSDDLIRDLIELAKGMAIGEQDPRGHLVHNAADEIVRLRAEVERLEGALDTTRATLIGTSEESAARLRRAEAAESDWQAAEQYEDPKRECANELEAALTAHNQRWLDWVEWVRGREMSVKETLYAIKRDLIEYKDAECRAVKLHGEAEKRAEAAEQKAAELQARVDAVALLHSCCAEDVDLVVNENNGDPLWIRADELGNALNLQHKPTETDLTTKD